MLAADAASPWTVVHSKHEFTLCSLMTEERLADLERMREDGSIGADEYRRLRLMTLSPGAR